MARRILVPIDEGTESTRGTAPRTVGVRGGGRHRRTRRRSDRGVYRTPELSDWKLWYEDATTEADEIFADAQAICDEYGVEVSTVTGRPDRAIVEYAETHDIDGVVIGSHGRDDTRSQLGSIAEAVVRRSPVLVTVIR